MKEATKRLQKDDQTAEKCSLAQFIIDDNAAKVLRTMNFVVKAMDFVLQVMDFVFKMMDFAFKMMNRISR